MGGIGMEISYLGRSIRRKLEKLSERRSGDGWRYIYIFFWNSFAVSQDERKYDLVLYGGGVGGGIEPRI